MQKRALGKSGLEIAPLMLGGNVFGWTADEATSFRMLDAFVDRGFDAIDTANVYSAWIPGHKGGESEAVLGRWFQQSGKRGRVVLATKVGMKMGDGSEGLKKENILRSVEESLTRLQTEVIDLYQSHKVDASTPLEETLSAYDELIQSGKVRAIGASNYTGARLAEAETVSGQESLPRYTTLQPEYNLLDREGFENDLMPVAEQFGLGVIPYFSLAAGFLTGKYKSFDDAKGVAREHRVTKYFNERGERVLKALQQVSEETGAQPASVALAWLMARPTITAPIASATSETQLEALFASVELKLSEAQMEALTQASAVPLPV